MFEHARDHAHLYRALVGSRGGAIALDTIQEILSDLVRDELGARRHPKDEMPREFIVRFLVGAYMAVLTWWLDGGAEEAPEELDAMFRRLAQQGLGPRKPDGQAPVRPS